MNTFKSNLENNFDETINKLNQIDNDLFKLYPEGLSEKQYKKALHALESYMNTQKEYFLGYQTNNNIHYDENIKQYLDVHINNVGDPFTLGNLTLNSKLVEQNVLDYYANLWNAKTPHSSDDGESYWGYCLSMGSTEGNMYSIWNARDYLGGKVLLIDENAEETAKLASQDGRPANISNGFVYYEAKPSIESINEYTPVAFFSQDAHYSIVKSMRVLNFQTFYYVGSENYECPLKYPDDYPSNFSTQYIGKNGWPLEVPSDSNGSMYIPAYVKLVEFFVSKGYPIYTCFNYGSTFKGAYDNVKKAIESVVPILKKYDMYEREVKYEKDGVIKTSKRNGFWFHVDGALGAAYMPFLEKALKKGVIQDDEFEFPHFDFHIPEVHSIVMSGHKWIGTPFSCGIFMTKTKYQLLPPDDPMYIGSPDTTFAGSRNGLAPILLWDYIAKHSYDMQIMKVVKSEELCKYTIKKLKELETKLNIDLWIERTPYSITIRFRLPSNDIVDKYSLSCETLYVDGKKRSYAHIYIMDHVNIELIQEFVFDLSKDGVFQN